MASRNKENQEKIRGYIGNITVARDMYMQRYAVICDEYEKGIASLKGNYITNSEKYREVKAKIEKKKADDTEKLRHELKKHISDESDKMRAHCKGEIRFFKSEYMDDLNRLKDLHLSYGEVEQLIEKYGNHAYWVDKLLLEIADKNNISTDKLNLEPSFDVKMGIIDELQNRIDSFLDGWGNYDGEKDVMLLTSVHDSQLFEFENDYSTSYNLKDLSLTQYVDRAKAIILSADDMLSRGISLNNALQSAPNNTVRYALIGALGDKMDSLLASPEIRKMYDNAIKNEVVKQYQEGKELVGKIALNDEQSASAVIYDHRDNPYFMEMVSDIAKSNNTIKNAIEIVQLADRE